MDIITNNHPRPLISWNDLTDKEKEDFDWVKEPENKSPMFFRYRGNCYCMQEFVRFKNNPWVGHPPEEFKDWDGSHGDSFFSGILVREIEEDCQVIVGMYLS